MTRPSSGEAHAARSRRLRQAADLPGSLGACGSVEGRAAGMARGGVPLLRVGCTSFTVQDEYVPAVRECVRHAGDISLLLLQAGDHGRDLPSPAVVRELKHIADDAGATWNVHLPTDGDFGSPGRARDYMDRVLRALELSLPLNPHTWVLHVVTDKRPAVAMQPLLTAERESLVLRSLGRLRTVLPAPSCLALENLERHPYGFLDSLIAQSDYSRCFDIGHVWKEGGRPEELLPLWRNRIRMCHLHGVSGRDHRSLHLMEAARLDPLLHRLWREGFDKPITLEVFSLDDYRNSLRAINASYERYRNSLP
ncbi:MAG: TIM barrel protein [Akkermansiaceae bacterium]|nr:TIM barrel protein [Akkermansia sp.]MCD7799349.1 TIM barrel protein [Akkermansiaceae bacterium]